MAVHDDDAVSFHLKFSSEASLGSDDPTCHVLEYDVVVHTCDEDGPGKRIGNFTVWHYTIGAYREKAGGALYDLFDADSAESESLFHALYDGDTEDIRQELIDKGLLDGCPIGSDVLHFQWGTFPSKYRLSNLLLAVVERTIECLGSGCYCATLWPWDAVPPDLKTATADEALAFFSAQGAHEEHWGRIGFRRIERTPILVRDMCKYGYDVDALLKGTAIRPGMEED